MIEKKYIKVAAGVLENDSGEILLCTRKLGSGGILWEFPGGKIEPGESASEAAGRELAEELDLRVYPADTMYMTVYDYGDKIVELHFVRCFCFDYSDMKMLDHQQYRWVDCNAIGIDELLPADKDFLKFLQIRANKIGKNTCI